MFKMTDDDGLEDWDEDFLNQAVQAIDHAERFRSSSSSFSSSSSSCIIPPIQPPLNYQQQHSPPRVLSQRIPSSTTTDRDHRSVPRVSIPVTKTTAPDSSGLTRADDAKEQEIERLKRELERVSDQLTNKEGECSVLRKERDKKEDKIKLVKEQRDGDHKSVNCGRESTISGADCHEVPQKFQNTKTSENKPEAKIDTANLSSEVIGVLSAGVSDGPPKCRVISEKLQSIWNTPSYQELGRNVNSRLLVTCADDFRVLFGCMGMNVSSKEIADSLAGESSSHADQQLHMGSCQTLEAAKVLYFYSVMTKTGNGMLPVEALFEPLLDLCSLGNVVIVHRSLIVLHMLLKHLLTMERNPPRRRIRQHRRAEKKMAAHGNDGVFHNFVFVLRVLHGTLQFLWTLLRDNVLVEGECSRNNDEQINGNESSKTRGLFCANQNEEQPDTEKKRALLNPGSPSLFSNVDWISLFELMCQVAVRSTEQHVKLEAVSIMIMILQRSNAHLEREKFGRTLVFESISKLLQRESGLHVQKEASRLLHLLLNCPKVLAAFCAGCTEAANAGNANDDDDLTSKRYNLILEAVAECLVGHLIDVQGLELRKNVIVLLAFLASTGKSGFEILVSHKLPQDANFLILILQVLVSEMDLEAAGHTDSMEILKARTLLVREGLILLNRLVSHPTYSGTVLRLLTNSRHMVNLTIDIANSSSWKDQRLKDTDVHDLAQVFKKRVYTYFGDVSYKQT